MRKKRKKLLLKSYSNIKYTISKERNKEREAVTMAEAAAGWSHFDSFGGRERVIFGTDNLLPGIFPWQIRN